MRPGTDRERERERDTQAVKHGHDITALANQEGVGWAEAQLVIRYNIKLGATHGAEECDDKSARTLSRAASWTEEGLEYEAGQ